MPFGGGRTGGAPQEGDDLSAGAGIVGAEQTVGLAVGDARLHSPFHSLGIIRIGGNVRKDGSRLLLDKLCGNSDLAAGHDEGILAVALIGQLELIAAGVLDGKLVQLVALIGVTVMVTRSPFGSVLGADGHIAVLGAGCGHSHYFLFCGRRRDRIKGLYWEKGRLHPAV